MKVNICGIKYDVIEKPMNFSASDFNFGEIHYDNAEIILNESLSCEIKEQTLCHEITHGILHHIGCEDLNGNEQFVQAISQAIFQGFEIKRFDSDMKGD